ncbi:hypothetical protein Daus18300_012892 [Diaporthe australafricana]|uniref:JmjC domain-containing protein n=1 Tax=Diaporthe australafricana TaxID=127596 RepID=A0ABR3W155_9PEZI
MDFSKRLEALELDIKDALQILQQKSAPTRRGSRHPISQDDPIISRLAEISEKMVHLKGLLELSIEERGEQAQNADGTADSEVSLGDSRIPSSASPPPGQAAETGGGAAVANRRSSIAITDMGFGLMQNLSRYGTGFSGKVHVSGFESFDLVKISNRIANPDNRASSLTVQHSSSSNDGVSELFPPRKQEFRFPDFSRIPYSAPQEYEKSFEAIITSTPRKPISYYVGPPLAPDFDTLLSPGKLLELGEIPGVTTPYWHAGEKDSGTAFHHEDGAMRSCNVTIAGFKLWIIIKESSNAKFEAFVQNLYPETQRPRCGQWLRHLNIFVSPEMLTKMSIGFDLILAGPGDMVVTAPGQYHAVLNLTACFAIAINFALADDPVLAQTIVCPKCGLYGFEHPSLQQVEEKVARPLRGHSKRLANKSLNQALVQPGNEADAWEPTTNSRQPSLGDLADSASLSGGHRTRSGVSYGVTNEDNSGSETRAEVAAGVLSRKAAVRSRIAVRQFCDLVDAKRNLQLHNVLFPYDAPNAARRLMILNGLKNSKTMIYINQYLFAVDIDKARDGMLRLPSETKDKIIKAAGLCGRQYEYHLQLGNQWRKVCGAFEGILCFIPSHKHNPFQVSATMYRDMDDQELEGFHDLLADEYTRTICAAGKSFQDSLGAQDSCFTWETKMLSKPLYKLPEEDMLSYIKPVPSLAEDKYCAAEFPDWPDPTLIPSEEKQCDYCSSPSCHCYSANASNTKSRIMVYPGKGLGLQAISAEPGAVVYRKNDLIGFLTGKLVPPGSLDKNQATEFYKCQIDSRDEGNEYRLINHACETHAAARLLKKKLSGRFRLCVLALKDINNGAEITITYSPEHEYLCEGCKPAATE